MSKARKGYSVPLARERIRAKREQEAERLRLALGLTVAERDALAERASKVQAERVGCNARGTFARAKYAKRRKQVVCTLKRRQPQAPLGCDDPPGPACATCRAKRERLAEGCKI